MSANHPMLEKAPCPDCKGTGGPRVVLVRNACETCLGRREVFAFSLDDLHPNWTYRCGELLLHSDADGNVQGRFDEWHFESWQPIETEEGLQSMLWSCLAWIERGKGYAG